MPDVRVTCPACRTRLELDAAFAGRVVRCGGCGEQFAAAADRPSARPRDDADRPRRRRRYADDDEPPKSSGGSAAAVVGLAFGAVSLMLVWCPCLAVVGVPLAVVGLVCSGFAAANPRSRTAGWFGVALNVVALVAVPAVWMLWTNGAGGLNAPADRNAPPAWRP